MSKILKLQYENPKTHAQAHGCLEIKNQSKQSADLYFYGDICSSTWDIWQEEDKCPQDVADFLNGLNGVKNINVYINSGGGDSFAGLAIYNILARNGAHIDVYVDALAASAAGLIAMVGCLDGNMLHMPPGSQLMLHKCWTIALGNADDFRKLADSLDKCDKSYVEVFSQSALDGVKEDQIEKMQQTETWMDGEEAAKTFKNVDTSGAEAVASVNSMFFSQYKNIPEKLKQAPKAKELSDKFENQTELAKAKLALELTI